MKAISLSSWKAKHTKIQGNKESKSEEWKTCKKNGSDQFHSFCIKYALLKELDITVQCQIDVFKWLLKYINPINDSIHLDYKNVSSILVSADSLVMKDLVEECLIFIKTHLKEIVKWNDNIPAFKSHLAKKLANEVSIEDLDALGDKKNYLLSRLFKKKLEIFFEK